jgi:hypothetical protein
MSGYVRLYQVSSGYFQEERLSKFMSGSDRIGNIISG